jgi:acyl dehydratase
MALAYEKIMSFDVPEAEQRLTRKDTMLYALGVGLGADPCDTNQLKFVYEKDLQALPTMAIILGYAGGWAAQNPELGVTTTHTVHGEQGFRILKPLPVEGDLFGKTRITGVYDKGPGKGALIMSENTVRDKKTGEAVCTLTSTTFARADGGFGGPSGPTKELHRVPETTPEFVCDLPTLPQAALIYRLSGDYNPLHADPAHARKVGFKMPILHGRGTFGVAGHAILKTLCGYDPLRFVSMEGRFSSPVYPGETIRTEMWKDGNVVSFKATVPARGVTVLTNGRAEVR